MKRRFLPLRRAYRATPPARWTALPAVTDMEVVIPIVRDPTKYANMSLDLADWHAALPASWPKPAARFLRIADFTGLADRLRTEAAKAGYMVHPRIDMFRDGPEQIAVRLSRPAMKEVRPIGIILNKTFQKGSSKNDGLSHSFAWGLRRP